MQLLFSCCAFELRLRLDFDKIFTATSYFGINCRVRQYRVRKIRKHGFKCECFISTSIAQTSTGSSYFIHADALRSNSKKFDIMPRTSFMHHETTLKRSLNWFIGVKGRKGLVQDAILLQIKRADSIDSEVHRRANSCILPQTSSQQLRRSSPSLDRRLHSASHVVHMSGVWKVDRFFTTTPCS